MEKKLVKKDIEKYKSIEAIGNLEGGKILIKALEGDVLNGFATVLSMYRSSTEIELRATIAKLASDYSLLKVLTRAGKNRKFAQQELARLMKEDPEPEDQE